MGSSRPAVHPAGVCTRRPQELCPLRQFGVAGMSGPTSQWGPRGVGDPQLRGAVKTPLGVETRVSPAPGARVLGVTGGGGGGTSLRLGCCPQPNGHRREHQLPPAWRWQWRAACPVPPSRPRGPGRRGAGPGSHWSCCAERNRPGGSAEPSNRPEPGPLGLVALQPVSDAAAGLTPACHGRHSGPRAAGSPMRLRAAAYVGGTSRGAPGRSPLPDGENPSDPRTVFSPICDLSHRANTLAPQERATKRSRAAAWTRSEHASPPPSRWRADWPRPAAVSMPTPRSAPATGPPTPHPPTAAIGSGSGERVAEH